MADTEKNTNHDDFIEDHVEDSENCEKNAPETAQKIEDMPPDNIAWFFFLEDIDHETHSANRDRKYYILLLIT